MKFIPLVAALLVTACANTKPPEAGRQETAAERMVQQRLEVASTMRYQKRIDPIADTVLGGGLRFCRDEVTYATGLRIVNRAAFPRALRAAASAELGLGSELQVLWVQPGSAGDKAGIKAGDKVMAINGEQLPTGSDGMEKLDEALVSAAQKKRPLNMTVQRNQETLKFDLETKPICHYPVVAVLNATPNAYANGSIIAVNSGLLHLLPEERDLAIVMCHELAHNVKNHPIKGLMASVLGLAVSLVLDIDDDDVGEMASAPFSPPLEAEADYVGLYICANAGVDIQGAENVWRKFAAEFAGAKSRTLLDTHPPTPERYVALKKTVAEINAKKAQGKPLVPNRAK